MSEKTISDREAEQLREKIAFINGHGAYRTVMTDAESACGILPRCTSPDHPAEDRESQWDVLDCCEAYPLIETWHEHIASVWVDSLYVIPALLDERDQQRKELAEARATTTAAYRERAHLVALLAAVYPAEFRENPDPDYADWPIIYVQLPTGQASWHISPNDMDLFPGVRFGTDAEWDGHTTDAKYDRIDKMTHMLHVEGGIEAVGGHRGAR